MAVLIGTSGWQYKDWRSRFYPSGLPQRLWLEHYAAAFDTVEVNNTFYRLPARDTFADWCRRVPRNFRFAVKASRYLTHILRLKDPEEPVRRLMKAAAPLRSRMGPVLVQLPPTLKADLPRLEAVLHAFSGRAQVAVEFRHESWFTDNAADLLAKYDVAWCLADRRSRPLGPVRRTASWGYVRFHEGAATPWPHYGDTALGTWAERLADLYAPGETVFAYFNNDPGGWAVRDAVVFASRLERVGLGASSVPDKALAPAG